MRLLVCGGRYFDDRERVFREMDRLSPSLVIHGGASGADRLAGLWAESRGIPLCVFPANWKRFGNMAGPKRNAWMLEHGLPNRVLAFPGGRGTENMVSQAEGAGIGVTRG